MATEAEVQSVSFSGSKKVQQVASRTFDVMRAHGMFMSDYAPIRVKQDDLVTFLAEKDGYSASEVQKAIAENPDVFVVATDNDGTALVVTTRTGKVPVADAELNDHTFQQRLMTPEPKPVTPVAPVRERVRVDPSWATFTVPAFGDDEYEDELEPQEEAGELDVVEAL
jgi:hypothetical protein